MRPAPAICLMGLLLLPSPALAAPFDGDWKGNVAAIRGCAGGSESAISLAVTGSALTGTVHNVASDVPFTGTLNADGSGTVHVARTEGTLHFDSDHFTMDWPGAAGCTRHGEGARVAAAPDGVKAPTPELEYVATFLLACLIVYPDQDRLHDYAIQHGGAEISAADYSRLMPIPGKAGRGWTFKDRFGDYSLFLTAGMDSHLAALMPGRQDPSCELTMRAPSDTNVLDALHAIEANYAKEHGLPLGQHLANNVDSVQMDMQMVGKDSLIGYFRKPLEGGQSDFRLEWRPQS